VSVGAAFLDLTRSDFHHRGTEGTEKALMVGVHPYITPFSVASVPFVPLW
jgi:hypothetical protein